MEEEKSQPKFTKLINTCTIQRVTKLLDRAKKCQGTAKNVLESKKKACTKNENGCKLNKYEGEEDEKEDTATIKPTIVSDRSIVRKKIDLKQNTKSCHLFNTIYGSKFKTSQIEKDVTLKDGNLHLKEIGNQCCFLATMGNVHVIDDSLIKKSSDDKRSKNVPLGV